MRYPTQRRDPSTTSAVYDPSDPTRWIALAVLLAAAAMDLIDTTVVTVALPVIGSALGTTTAALLWIVAGYGLAFALGQIVGGRLGDVFGRRRAFLIGLTGFTAASAACGLAPSSQILVAMRFTQGMFAALMVPQVLAIIAASFPPSDRARAYGLFGVLAGLATLIGPLLSGVLLQADLFGWRSIFLVNVPIGVALIAAAHGLLRESHSEQPPRLDLAGAGLLTVALVLLAFPLIEGRQLGWPVWTLAAMVASLPGLALFALHQRRRERHGTSPLVPPALFRQPAFARGTLATLMFFSIPPALLLIATVTLQALGFTPLQTALSFIPLSLASAMAAAASATFARRLSRRLVFGGTLLVALGIAGMLLAPKIAGGALTPWPLVPGMGLTGLGLGLVAPRLIDITLSGVEPGDAGAASGVRSTASQLGSAMGVALAGVVFYGLLTSGTSAGYARAFAGGLHYALAVAILSALSMLLLPGDAERGTGAVLPDKSAAGEYAT